MRFPAAILCVCAASVALASPQPEVASLLGKMRAAYSSTKAAKLTTKTVIHGQGKSLTIASHVLFQPPLRIQVSSTGIPGVVGGTFKAISNGKNLFLAGLPGGAMTQPASIDTVERALPQFNLEVLCFWDFAKQLSTQPGGNMNHSTFALKKETWKGKSWTVLEETAKAQNAFVRYFIDPKTSFIWRTLYMTLSSKAMRQEAWIELMEINKPVDSKAFTVPTPKAIKV
jgi:hypothetical protein